MTASDSQIGNSGAHSYGSPAVEKRKAIRVQRLENQLDADEREDERQARS